jgi:hypothetical protein
MLLAVRDVHRDLETETQIRKSGFGPLHGSLLNHFYTIRIVHVFLSENIAENDLQSDQ